MKYSVGLQKINSEEYIQLLLEHKEEIYEVYFSWGDFPNGRSNQLADDTYTPWELQDHQRSTLQKLSDAGIHLNLLFNANCYGKDSLARRFYEKIGAAVDYIQENYGLQSVTTTSPLIAKFIKDNFLDLELRASVNMSIGTICGMEYLAEYFDSYYIKRECNRDMETIKSLHTWAEKHGKQLFLLGNSGCLNHCSAHTFHDNLVAHESEIAAMDNAYEFQGICRTYLGKTGNYSCLIHNTSFVRPEDVSLYEPYIAAIKLATRVHKNPEMVLKSYLQKRYSGNILELLEPAHNIYPYVVENGEPLKLKKLEEYEMWI